MAHVNKSARLLCIERNLRLRWMLQRCIALTLCIPSTSLCLLLGTALLYRRFIVVQNPQKEAPMHRRTELLAQKIEIKRATLVELLIILPILQVGLVCWQAPISSQCLFHVLDRAYLAATATAIDLIP